MVHPNWKRSACGDGYSNWKINFKMPKRTLRIIDLFAGLGGFRLGIEAAAADAGYSVETAGYSECDSYAIKSYRAIHGPDGEVEMGDIRDFARAPAKLGHVDIAAAGFPCQPFSMMGKEKGFNDSRGGVFFDLLKVLSATKPKFVCLENVKGLLTHNKGESFERVVSSLRELGYKHVEHAVFNTADYGLPQVRNRVFILAKRHGKPFNCFSEAAVREHFRSIKKKRVKTFTTVHDILEQEVLTKFYLSERIKPTILSSGTGGFKANSEINQTIARPLTSTMVKLHRACQDNYYSDDFIQTRGAITTKSCTMKQLLAKRIRKITPKEAFMLQGFTGDQAYLASSAGVSDHQLLKQAGNAVSVNVVYAIFQYIFKKEELN
jgi:DNA (cytosine-5)-methyltransferase 1